MSQPNLQAPRRLLQDTIITDGAYFRVHLHPKRFPAAYEVQDWRARIVHDGAEFVVVNKPPGLQVWLRHSGKRGSWGCYRDICLHPIDKRALGRTCISACLRLTLPAPPGPLACVRLWKRACLRLPCTTSEYLFAHDNCPQVPPTVDNLRESLMAKVEEVRGLH